MRWLITGGCGFVGSNLADALLKGGADVVVLDNMSRLGAHKNLAWLHARHGGEWRFERRDVRVADEVTQIIDEVRPDVIAHLAGQVAMTTSLENPRLDFETNALGSFNVLDAVRQRSPATIVLYSSSNKVYGALDHLCYEERPTRHCLVDYPDGLDEQMALEGHTPYGCSKLTADQYMRDFHRMYGVRTVVFRHSSMYGGRQFATADQGWVGWFCQQALTMADPETPPFTISGDGKQVRDLLHADDLVQLYQLAAHKIDNTAGQVYNVGGGQANSLSLLELFTLLEERCGHALRFTRLPCRIGDQKVFVANIARIQAAVQWTPIVTAPAGVQRMLHWLREGCCE
jgi:CDP-paratose 2-epimerase